jgi:hypothetical protein
MRPEIRQSQRLLLVIDAETETIGFNLPPLSSLANSPQPSLLKVRPRQFEFLEQRFDANRYPELIQALRDRQFDAAVILTAPERSPYALAYLCYLAGIPIRVGQSREFGGGVLSHCIAPPIDPVALLQYHLHLFQSIESSL